MCMHTERMHSSQYYDEQYQDKEDYSLYEYGEYGLSLEKRVVVAWTCASDATIESTHGKDESEQMDELIV